MHKRKQVRLTTIVEALIVSLLLSVPPAAAAPGPAPEPTPAAKPAPAPVSPIGEWMSRLKIEGRGFFRYSYEMGKGADDFNEINVDRAYLTATVKLSQKLSLKYTLEGGDLRESGGDYFDVATKHFMLDLQDPIGKNTFLRFGLADLPWVPYEESIWSYRVQGTVFPDRSGYLTSTDLNVGLGGKLDGGYGSWHVALANGEGWKKKETGKYKDLHARLQLNPFASSKGAAKDFFLTGFVSLGKYDLVTEGPDDKRRMILYSAYKRPDRLVLAAEYLRTNDPADKLTSRHPSLAARAGKESDGVGTSLYTVLNMSNFGGGEAAKKWDIIARWDHLDPDDEIDDNDLDRAIFGFSYRWNKAVQSLFDYEQVDYDENAGKKEEKRFLFQTDVRF